MPPQTPFSIELKTGSVDETRLLGVKMGRNIHDSTVIRLSGDLGSGKTAFVQGLAKGLDVPEDYYITSPTYTLLNEYPGRLPLYHFDFYRLQEDADIESTGFFEIMDTNGIIAIEWAERLSKSLSIDHIHMEFNILDDHARLIKITSFGLESTKLLRRI